MKPFESFMGPELEQYLAWRDQQGYSTESLRCQLGAFDRYLGMKADPGQPFQPAFFLRLRQELTVEPRTVNTILSAVRGFFQFRVRQGLCEENPLKDIPALAQRTFIPFLFSVEQTDQMLSAICKSIRRTTEYFLLDLAVWLAIMLLAHCGMRLSEPLGLLRSHWRPREETLYIENTKFGKDRLIPVPGPVGVQILNCLAVRSALLFEDQNPYLLAGRQANPLQQHQIYRAFHQAVSQIGLNQPRRILGNMIFGAPTVHSLRHNADSRIMPRWVVASSAFPVFPLADAA